MRFQEYKLAGLDPMVLNMFSRVWCEDDVGRTRMLLGDALCCRSAAASMRANRELNYKRFSMRSREGPVAAVHVMQAR